MRAVTGLALALVVALAAVAARASELYGTLESGAGSWAQNAIYARGRLEASRGNRAEARLLLEQYLERFPNGTNAEDARAVLRRLR